jgi:transcriptional regulator with XRE-family HTH domain
MTLHDKRKKNIISEFKDKEYRDAFVSEQIDTGIPFQIRALRKQRNLTQKKVAELAGMEQARISVMEDPNYEALTLSTLKKLASAFDIGLLVRFVAISDLVEWELNLSPDSLEVPSYDEDPYFKETKEPVIEAAVEVEADSTKYPTESSALGTSAEIIYFKDLVARQATHLPVTDCTDCIASGF